MTSWGDGSRVSEKLAGSILHNQKYAHSHPLTRLIAECSKLNKAFISVGMVAWIYLEDAKGIIS